MLPFTTVRVVGSSMEPSLANGEWWVVRRGGRVTVGDVIVLAHPERPGLHIVKRVIRRVGVDGWWVEGDSSATSDDSRSFGVVSDHLVRGRLLVRYQPLPPKRVPRRGG